MAKAFIDDENLTDIADAIRATLDESRQYLPSEMAAAIESIPIIAQLNRKKYFQPVPAGAASGYANIEKVEGNTVEWNQLIMNGDFSNGYNSWTRNRCTASVNSNIVTLTNTQSTTFGIYQYVNLIGSHKYYISISIQTEYGYNIKYGTNTIFYSSYSSTSFSNLKSIIDVQTTDIYTFTIYTRVNSTTGSTFQLKNIMIIDLTTIFKAGNEPSTVADFEAWMAQNIGTLPYYDYNAGELLSVKMSGMQTEDSSQQMLDTLPFDVTTFTGINTVTNVREVMFADGMKKADSEETIKDELDLLSDTATVNVGSRAYQSGDESDTSVITDGTTTYYALTTPIIYTDLQDANGNPLNPRYKVEHGGTEQVLPVNTSTPTTVAPTLTTTYTKENN